MWHNDFRIESLLVSDFKRTLGLYLRTVRSDSTRQNAFTLIKFLLERRENQFPGWTRSGYIFSSLREKIPNPNIITRLLKDLTKYGVILRKECLHDERTAGKVPVFYRAAIGFTSLLLFTQEELITTLLKTQEELDELKNQFWVLKDIHCKAMLGEEYFSSLMADTIEGGSKRSRFYRDLEKKIADEVLAMRIEKMVDGPSFEEECLVGIDPCQSLIKKDKINKNGLS